MPWWAMGLPHLSKIRAAPLCVMDLFFFVQLNLAVSLSPGMPGLLTLSSIRLGLSWLGDCEGPCEAEGEGLNRDAGRSGYDYADVDLEEEVAGAL